uniref:Plakophilin 4 n=1 Tax=Sarcophilus harrisii TaxID=9305 RepID=A0A7N4PBT4_SARHA
ADPLGGRGAATNQPGNLHRPRHGTRNHSHYNSCLCEGAALSLFFIHIYWNPSLPNPYLSLELQFQRLTRELEVERQIVASQLERCRLGAESPSIASTSSTEKSFPWRSAEVPNTGVSKPRTSDSVHPTTYLIRTEAEQSTLYSPEQTSLHESEGSLGNSRSSTQMNSYSDSGYQEPGSFHNSQNLGKADNRQQHSFLGSSNNHLVRNSRAEGQTLVQFPSFHNCLQK